MYSFDKSRINYLNLTLSTIKSTLLSLNKIFSFFIQTSLCITAYNKYNFLDNFSAIICLSLKSLSARGFVDTGYRSTVLKLISCTIGYLPKRFAKNFSLFRREHCCVYDSRRSIRHYSE